MAKVSDDEVLLLWRALMAYRSGPRPACRAQGKPPRSPCPLYARCPRLGGPGDYLAVMGKRRNRPRPDGPGGPAPGSPACSPRS